MCDNFTKYTNTALISFRVERAKALVNRVCVVLVRERSWSLTRLLELGSCGGSAGETPSPDI